MAIRINKQELASTIRNLQELTDEQKSALLELLHEKKQYGLVWENHEEDVEEQLREQLPVLKEVPEHRILSEDKDAPNHILIEGDNLHALTSLCYTHEGKIDVIYIDPPYNTGNKDFVYNDSFVDSEDGYRHSKWLSFMEKRLRIAKKLLSDKGVIFISIDDNEQANLKLLCDEVFGGKNFIAQIIWERAFSPVNLKKHFSESHDYIISYSKDILQSINNGLPRNDEADTRYRNPDNDPRGIWTSGDLSVGPRIENKVYEIITPSGRVVWPPSGYCWRIDKPTYERYLAENRIWFGEHGDNVPRIKRFLSEVKQGITPMTVWKYGEVGHSQDATKELKDIFNGEAKFTYPKSVRLIQRIIHLYSQPGSIILDFFAGSGTTLHATMQLNAEDGGHRQCILVTNNENNICEEVTYERNKRVINGYTKPNGDFVEGLHDNNLRYYKTEFVSRENSSANRKALMSMTTDLLCIKENLYDEVPFEIDGKKMKPQFVRCFESDDKTMIIIYDPRAVDVIAKSLPEKDVRQRLIYVYSDGQYAYNDEFKGKDVELCALPDAIYQALNRVMPRQKEIKL